MPRTTFNSNNNSSNNNSYTNNNLKISDLNSSQIQLGWWKENPFITMSPVFDAYKSDTPKVFVEGEKPFDHNSGKIFLTLTLEDLVKLNNKIIPAIENNEFQAAQIEHISNLYPKKTIEIGRTAEFPCGYIELCQYNTEGNYICTLFDFAAKGSTINNYFITNPDSNGIGTKLEMDLIWEEFKLFISTAIMKKLSFEQTKSNYNNNYQRNNYNNNYQRNNYNNNNNYQRNNYNNQRISAQTTRTTEPTTYQMPVSEADIFDE